MEPATANIDHESSIDTYLRIINLIFNRPLINIHTIMLSVCECVIILRWSTHTEVKGLRSTPSPPKGFEWPLGSPSPVVEE